MKKLPAFFSAIAASVTVLCAAPSAQADSVRIIANPGCTRGNQVNVGHVTIAFYDARNNLVGTKGMWPSNNILREGPGTVRTDYSADRTMASGSSPCGGTVSRTANVSASRRNWLWYYVATPAGTDCRFYMPLGKIAGSQSCSCVNFATRVWRVVTANQEQWQYQPMPATVAAAIIFANGGRQYGVFDNGREWQ